MLVIMDGSDYVCLPPSQDHKRAFDGDDGPIPVAWVLIVLLL